MKRHGPEARRAVALAVALAASLVAGCGSLGGALPPRRAPDAAEVHALHERLAALLRGWVDQRALARDDGYLYGTDLGQALTYAALAGDLVLYEQLRAMAVEMVIDDRSDPYTQGFARWRHRPGGKTDASGTTEALWLARGLWSGARAFGRPADGLLARRLIDGYRRHEFTEAGMWYVRNYFDFGTRSFATNSYTVGYLPDFLDEVATATGDARIGDLAQRSRGLLLAAVTPGGMLNSIVQPEVTTIFPDLNLNVFAPNGIVALAESCAAAEAIAAADPAPARAMLGAVAREGHYEYFMAASGQRYAKSPVDHFPAACLLRLAVRLRDERAVALELSYFHEYADGWARSPRGPRLATAAQLLLTLNALESKAR